MFYYDGLDALVLDLEEIAETPDDVIYEMLEAGGKVVVEAQKKQIDSLGLVDTGTLRDSIAIDHKRNNAAGIRYIHVYPQGAHGSYKSRVQTKAYKRSKSGRTYTFGGDQKETTNAELGFIYEFGAPGKNIDGKMWMLTANEGCADEAVSAEFEVYDNYLKSKNL